MGIASPIMGNNMPTTMPTNNTPMTGTAPAAPGGKGGPSGGGYPSSINSYPGPSYGGGYPQTSNPMAMSVAPSSIPAAPSLTVGERLGTIFNRGSSYGGGYPQFSNPYTSAPPAFQMPTFAATPMSPFATSYTGGMSPFSAGNYGMGASNIYGGGFQQSMPYVPRPMMNPYGRPAAPGGKGGLLELAARGAAPAATPTPTLNDEQLQGIADIRNQPGAGFSINPAAPVPTPASAGLGSIAPAPSIVTTTPAPVATPTPAPRTLQTPVVEEKVVAPDKGVDFSRPAASNYGAMPTGYNVAQDYRNFGQQLAQAVKSGQLTVAQANALKDPVFQATKMGSSQAGYENMQKVLEAQQAALQAARLGT